MASVDSTEPLANMSEDLEHGKHDALEVDDTQEQDLPMEKSKKKGKGGKSATRRGDGAMSASRGTGFEGKSSSKAYCQARVNLSG